MLAFVFLSGCLSFYFKSSFLIDTNELKTILRELKYRIGIQSAKLLRQLKQKDRLLHKVQRNCDIVTACLQAVSQKRSKCWSGVSPLATCDWMGSELSQLVVFLNLLKSFKWKLIPSELRTRNNSYSFLFFSVKMYVACLRLQT